MRLLEEAYQVNNSGLGDVRIFSERTLPTTEPFNPQRVNRLIKDSSFPGLTTNNILSCDSDNKNS